MGDVYIIFISVNLLVNLRNIIYKLYLSCKQGICNVNAYIGKRRLEKETEDFLKNMEQKCQEYPDNQML